MIYPHPTYRFIRSHTTTHPSMMYVQAARYPLLRRLALPHLHQQAQAPLPPRASRFDHIYIIIQNTYTRTDTHIYVKQNLQDALNDSKRTTFNKRQLSEDFLQCVFIYIIYLMYIHTFFLSVCLCLLFVPSLVRSVCDCMLLSPPVRARCSFFVYSFRRVGGFMCLFYFLVGATTTNQTNAYTHTHSLSLSLQVARLLPQARAHTHTHTHSL